MKTLKKLKKKYHLDLLLKLVVPFAAIIWILWQIAMLSKYNAIGLFSWSQVFSDTSILLWQIISFSIGLWASIVFKDFKISKWAKFSWFLSILICFFLTFIVLGIMKWDNVYLQSMLFIYIVWYITPFFNFKDNWKHSKKWVFLLPSLVLFIIFVACVCIFSLLGIFYWYVFNTIDIEIENNTYPVHYMNDRYIIYWENKVTSNNGTYNFILWERFEQRK